MTQRQGVSCTTVVLGLSTVEPGVYNIKIAFREDGALLDAWMIAKQFQ